MTEKAISEYRTEFHTMKGITEESYAEIVKTLSSPLVPDDDYDLLDNLCYAFMHDCGKEMCQAIKLCLDGCEYFHNEYGVPMPRYSREFEFNHNGNIYRISFRSQYFWECSYLVLHHIDREDGWDLDRFKRAVSLEDYAYSRQGLFAHYYAPEEGYDAHAITGSYQRCSSITELKAYLPAMLRSMQNLDGSIRYHMSGKSEPCYGTEQAPQNDEDIPF